MDKRKVQSIIFYCDSGRKKQILLLQMNKKRNLLWQNVTGSVDAGEDFRSAAIREAKEETALTSENINSITETDLVFNFHDQWKKDVTEKVFIIQCNQHWDVKLDPSEHEHYKWISEEDLTRDSVHYESNYQALSKALELQC